MSVLRYFCLCCVGTGRNVCVALSVFWVVDKCLVGEALEEADEVGFLLRVEIKWLNEWVFIRVNIAAGVIMFYNGFEGR